jgi:hypothetical protein
MSYSRIGALVTGPGVSSAIVSARPLLGDMLAKLQEIASSSITFNGKTAVQFKVLPSSAESLDPEPCGAFQCSGNVVIWPATQYTTFESAWAVATAYVGQSGAFALRLTNIGAALAATQALLSAVDVKMAFEGLQIKKASGSYLPYIIGAGALVGAVLALNQSKGGKKGRRRPRRRARRRRR